MSMHLYIDRDNTVEQLEAAPGSSNLHMINTLNLIGYETDYNGGGSIPAEEVPEAINRAISVEAGLYDDPMMDHEADHLISDLIEVMQEAESLGCGVYWA